MNHFYRHVKSCPTCSHGFTGSFLVTTLGIPPGERVEARDHVALATCPNCHRFLLLYGEVTRLVEPDRIQMYRDEMVWPRSISPRPLPPEVPDPYASEFGQAVSCLFSANSPMASAALSRRCLQNVLRNKHGIQKRDLDKEIQEVIDSGKYPPTLAESLDAVRTIGNFAAHPIKSQTTGLVVEVEPGEAEWLLDVLEELFEFTFVQPSRVAARRAALNAKLADAGKPDLKKAPP